MSVYTPPGYPLPPRPKRGPGFGFVVAGSIVAILFGGFVTAGEAATLHYILTPPVAAPGSTTSSVLDATPATDDQKIGVVTIDTDLYYGQGAAAGTGMILTQNGTILTNNHVVEGSTSITVTVESTGATYTADVVGTDPTDDIAVLQLQGASGLSPVDIDKAAVKLGDTVTSIGNAQGTGDLVAATGTVTATNEHISVTDELTGKPKQLTGLIRTDADVVSGDSGGPLVDSDRKVVGIVTAASSGAQVSGYAIPIATALTLAHQMIAGQASDTVSLGLPAFLGVTISDTATGGALITDVLGGKPAAAAGLVAGDTITAIDGVAIADYAALTAAMDAHQPGDTIAVTFTDTAGTASTVTITLVGGPAE